MPPKQKYTDPKLRDEVKEEIQQGDKGGAPGQWSARKAQMMAKEYKNRGGDYNTPKSAKDKSAKHLDQWGEEDWQTKEGSGIAKQDDGSRKRYLPKKAWEQMSEKEREETDQKKQEEGKDGKQYVENTGQAKQARKDVAEKENSDAEGEDENSADDDGNEEKQKKKPKPKSTPKSTSKKSSGKNESEKAKRQRKGNKLETAGEAKDEVASEDSANDSNTSEISSQKENQRPSKPQGQKRTRKQMDESEHEQEQDQTPKKRKPSSNKSSSSASKSSPSATIGSNHDPSTPPAKQGSNSRLPKKGQRHVHWKAMPGWVEGEVVEIVKADKEVEGKKVKASKGEPRVVLKSGTSGKICVHRADNLYFN